MSQITDLTVLILTYNESPNLERTLEAVKWAPRILIIDSESTDDTRAIAQRFSQCTVLTRRFDTFAKQCNFGLSQIKSEWVLSMDADYEVTSDLSAEIQRLTPNEDVAGYSTSFIYCVHGAPLRATIYPPRTTLYRRKYAHYVDEGHGHRAVIKGNVEPLKGRIRHDDRKPLSRWIDSQVKYAAAEARYLRSAPNAGLKRTDYLRLMGWPAPILVFFYTLLWKRCILDGWPGWIYVLQRTLAETMIALEIADQKTSSV